MGVRVMGVEVFMTDYELFSKWLSYDEKSGNLTWRMRRGPVRAGHVVKTVGGDGYFAVALYGKQYRVHRVAWLLHYGSWPEGDIDHINGDKVDNRIENLRVCDDERNQWNVGSRGGVSKYKGVDWHKKTGRWRARIRVGKSRRIELGYYRTQEEAAAAYDRAADQYHEDFAKKNLNLSQETPTPVKRSITHPRQKSRYENLKIGNH